MFFNVECARPSFLCVCVCLFTLKAVGQRGKGRKRMTCQLSITSPFGHPVFVCLHFFLKSGKKFFLSSPQFSFSTTTYQNKWIFFFFFFF